MTEHLRVLLVSGNDAPTDRAIEAVFSGDSLHRFTQQSAPMLDLSALDTWPRRTLWYERTAHPRQRHIGCLGRFVKAGGSLAIFPTPTKADVAAYAPLFQRFGGTAAIRQDTARMKVDRIDLDLPFYRDVFLTMPRNVDLPWSRERWNMVPKAGSDILLRLQDGSPYLARTQAERGSVYFCATPLAASAGNLTQHALFATSLLRMAELSRPMGPLYHAIGAEAMIPIDGLELTGETPPHLRGPEGMDLVPELRRTPTGAQLVLHDWT
ncbi:MAG: hypothetical protein IPH05_14350 [Flavobacteriales bacterium]|nr:hypothetical protein [Flavobacteriales bacterium]